MDQVVVLRRPRFDRYRSARSAPLSIVRVANGHVEDVLHRRELRVASVVVRDLVRCLRLIRHALSMGHFEHAVVVQDAVECFNLSGSMRLSQMLNCACR